MRKAIGSGSVMEPVSTEWGDPPRTLQSINMSRDGRYIVGQLVSSAVTGADIWMMPVSGSVGKPRAFLQTRANESLPSLSPSASWITYGSDESGRMEVYTQSFPEPGRKYQISVKGGNSPIWSRDGRELFFLGPDLAMMAAPIRDVGGKLEIGSPTQLFDPKIAGNKFDVSKDGRFLIPVRNDAAASPLNLIVNWQSLTQR